MAAWLTPRTLDLEVRGSSLAHCIDSLIPQTGNFTPPCLSSPRCINGYLRYTAGGGGVTLQWTSILSRQGGVAILLGMLHAKETRISSSHLDF